MPGHDDPIFGLVLGYDLAVDIYKNSSDPYPLKRSTDYAIDVIEPYNVDTYGMDLVGHFPEENYREFQIVYYPPRSGQGDTEQLFILKYWDAMRNFDAIASRTKSTILGLADLANTTFVIRLTDCVYQCDRFRSSGPAITLSALKMRIGDEETIFTHQDLRAPKRKNSGETYQQIYRVPMPSTFSLLMEHFDTVRSDLEKRPMSEVHLGILHPNTQ